jgi:Copper transport outer membrane protein, MctB
MFDVRYHVASLAAVFVALLIGILVGVAMSGKVDDAEKQSLKSDVSRLQAQLDAASEGRANFSHEQKAMRAFVKNAYPSLIADRLREKKFALLFVGPVDAGIRQDIERAITDAGSSAPIRIRALKVPIDPSKIEGKLNGQLAQYRNAGLEDLGRQLGRELVEGGETPAWDALTPVLVEERTGSFRRPVDGVVVARTVKAQGGQTALFMSGLYSALGDIDVPTIGVEPSDVSESAVPVWSNDGLSTVDDIDTPAGRLALALLLSGSPIGNYGVHDSADDGIVPPIEPLPAAQTGG